MIVSDAHNFASRLSRNMEEIQRERQMYIEKLSSGKKVEKSTDDAGALSNKIKQAERDQKRLKVNRNLTKCQIIPRSSEIVHLRTCIKFMTEWHNFLPWQWM